MHQRVIDDIDEFLIIDDEYYDKIVKFVAVTGKTVKFAAEVAQILEFCEFPTMPVKIYSLTECINSSMIDIHSATSGLSSR